MRHRKLIFLVIAIACVLAASIVAFIHAKSLPDPARITLFVSGDSRGYLEPCGCRRDQAGGLSGRATIIESAPRSSRLVLDVGNLTAGSRSYELLKLSYLMEGMRAIGYDAVNLGRNEAELDLPSLQHALTADLPFVSANVVIKKNGQPVTRRYLVLRRGRVNIGVTGVTYASETECGPGVSVKPAAEALAEVVPELKRQCDYLIVLAYVDTDTITRIADQFPEIDCILGGDVPQSSGSIQIINRAASFNVTDRGKVIGQLDLVRKGSSYAAVAGRGIKVMEERLAPNSGMKSLVGRYKQELRNRRYELASAEGMETIHAQQSTADEFVGAAACKGCHAGAHRIAASTPHMHAFDTLVKKGSEFDPECLRCHTVGYGLYTGFVDSLRTPGLENVQCESCHGRGSTHVREMQALAASNNGVAHAKQPPAAALRPVTPASCVRCHDVENSENFNYKSFWPRIAH